MSTFIVWPIDENDKIFRKRYFEVIGEEIQETPKTNFDNTFFQVGSSIAKNSQLQELEKEFNIIYGKNLPAWWVDKIVEE